MANKQLSTISDGLYKKKQKTKITLASPKLLFKEYELSYFFTLLSNNQSLNVSLTHQTMRTLSAKEVHSVL